MAVQANFACPERDKFQYCFSKLVNFSYREDDGVKRDLNILLDQLNSLDYTTVIVREQDGNLLISKFCRIVPLHEDRLVVKMSQVVNNWKRKQNIQLTDECLSTVTEYLIKAIERCQPWARPDILRTIATLIYENCDRISRFHEAFLGNRGVLVQLINDDVTDTETLRESVLCLECLTIKPQSTSYLSQVHIDVCFDIFTMLLHKMPSTKLDQILQSKILINCLWGIRNLLQVTKVMPPERLGVILAVVRTYMFFGLYGQETVVPASLYPSPLTTQLPVLGKPAVTPGSKSQGNKEDNSSNKGQSQKKTKRRTKKKTDKKSEKKEDEDEDQDTSLSASVSNAAMETGGSSLDAEMSFNQTWARISSSESEWSDTEGGQGSRLRSNCTKVRQCALSCFYWIAKTTDKKLMFGYWSSFIPNSQSPSNIASTQTLFTIVLKDPSPKCRMGALAALSVLVDGTKMLLNAAVDSEDSRLATFTPFSVILGQTIKEIHRCLLLALVSEEYPITLTQLIKCLGTVIANVPYHRMRPGLLSRIVKQIKYFINHRDPNVRVACLTCLGAMAGIQPPLMEVCHIIQPSRPPVSSRQPVPTETESQARGSFSDLEPGVPINPAMSRETDSGFSSSPSVGGHFGTLQPGGGAEDHSGGVSPRKSTASSSGIQTPVFSDQMLQMHSKDISWTVKLCVKNILPQPPGDGGSGFTEPYVEPLPVRLESLQVLAHLTKGYFPIIRNCVPLLQELVHTCYCDRDPVIKLHTAKLLDEFTQVLLQDLQASPAQSTDAPTAGHLNQQQVLEFWLSLLNGPIQEILQNPKHGAVRATTCDCLANIGPDIFILLPLDKRIMCLTVVLGLTNDEDRFIRASAIRTLGVFVLYKSLREDVSFVADTTTAVLDAMEDKNMAVKVKAAWSLANLCDALALNREDGDTEFMTDFSEVLLLNVITMATRACQESDKVKANGVRALGNILRYVTGKNLGKETFAQAVTNGVKALLKNVGTGAMKVRWNACYAISNMYKNRDLQSGSFPWNVEVLTLLCTVVRDCKNFKVRINAAIALSSPPDRAQYGEPVLYCSVWQGLIAAFETAEDIADFIDFRYRDSLTDQICIAVLHLVSVVTKDDLDPLGTLLGTDGERLQTYLDKYYTARKKEAQLDTHLAAAMSRLEVVGKEDLTTDQSSCAEILTNICTYLATGEEDREKAEHKIAFSQTYD